MVAARILLFWLFMRAACPYCVTQPSLPSAKRNTVRTGTFYRRSDGRTIQRFKCKACNGGFSQATAHRCFDQKKRHLNWRIFQLFCSGMSERRLARYFNVNRKTIARKLRFLAEWARRDQESNNLRCPKVRSVEFDDMESIEHSKCKPVAISLAVETGKRRILVSGVASMPCKGRLAKKALEKYGPRADDRTKVRREVFKKLKEMMVPGAKIKSDQNPHYPKDIKEFFPDSPHLAYKGRRGREHGLGELKVGGFDEIFSFNHTAAMFRANINRLFRKTWCTTKKIERLADHIALYIHYHNEVLLKG